MPDLLTSSHQSDYLDSEAQSASRLDKRIEEAEIRVVDRYLEDENAPLYFELGAGSPGRVHLRGWEEKPDGSPDLNAIDSDLLDALRIVIGNVVEWQLKHEELEEVESESQGSKSVSYRDLPALPSRLFQPLRRYDQREGITGLW